MNRPEKLYIILMLSFAFSMAFTITIGYLFMLGEVVEKYIPELYDTYRSYMLLGSLIGSSAILLTAGVYDVSKSVERYTKYDTSAEDTVEGTTKINCENCSGCVPPDNTIEEGDKDDI